jgi:predicted MFS family arabinose efflux permease
MTFVLAMINEAFRPAGMTAIGAFSNAETRTRSSSLVRLSVNLGWAIGASIGGLIASYNYQYLFWVDGWTNLFAAFIVLFFLKNRPIVKELPKTQTTLFVSAYKDKAYMIFIFLSLLFAICFFQVFTTLPLYLKRELLLSERQIGLTMALNGLLIALFEMVIITKISKKTNELNYIILGTLIVGFSYILFNLFPINPFLIAVIASIIITIGEILSMPFMMSFWLNRSNESNRGQYAALYTVSYSAAHILGPSFGGLIADHYGFHILWWVIFIMSIFTALGYYYLKQNESRIDLKSLV